MPAKTVGVVGTHGSGRMGAAPCDLRSSVLLACRDYRGALMRKFSISLIATTACLLFFAGFVQAAPPEAPGWYVGADAGFSQLLYPNGAELDSNSYGAHGGYRINRYLAIEAGYADLGSYRFENDCPPGFACNPESVPVRVHLTAKRADIAALGILPMGESFDAYARLGYGRARFSESVKPGLYAADEFSSTTDEMTYGVGVRMHFKSSWSLRLQWDRLPGISTYRLDIESYWLGAEYRFGG